MSKTQNNKDKLSQEERDRIAELSVSIEHLEVIHKYEKLRAEIQEYRYRRLRAIEMMSSYINKDKSEKEEDHGDS